MPLRALRLRLVPRVSPLDTLRLPYPAALALCLLGGSLECAVLALRRGLAAAGMRLAARAPERSRS